MVLIVEPLRGCYLGRRHGWRSMARKFVLCEAVVHSVSRLLELEICKDKEKSRDGAVML